jgi:hypothetical protein
MYTLVCVGFVASCFLSVELQSKIAVYKYFHTIAVSTALCLASTVTETSNEHSAGRHLPLLHREPSQPTPQSRLCLCSFLCFLCFFSRSSSSLCLLCFDDLLFL